TSYGTRTGAGASRRASSRNSPAMPARAAATSDSRITATGSRFALSASGNFDDSAHAQARGRPPRRRRDDRSDDRAGPRSASGARHTPPLTLPQADTVAVAEYIHSVQAVMGGQGSPPGRNPAGIELNVLVGDAKTGEAYFARVCSRCHSVSGDLKGIGSRFP